MPVTDLCWLLREKQAKDVWQSSEKTSKRIFDYNFGSIIFSITPSLLPKFVLYFSIIKQYVLEFLDNIKGVIILNLNHNHC